MFEHINEAIKDLQENNAFSGNYTLLERYDYNCNKMRVIAVPTFKDLVIQHALVQVINPVLSRGEYKYSCACIKKKGSLYASMSLRKMMKKIKDKKCYYLKIDIRKYFPNIDCSLLLKKLNKVIKDQKVIEYIKTIIISYENGEKGLPIGWFTSQILANFYLQDFDHYVKEVLKIPYYVRYMDDMHFIDFNKRKLKRNLTEMRLYLDLPTHEDKEQVIKITENNFVDLCGYRHYKNKITIRRKIYHRILKIVKGLKRWICQKRIKRLSSYLGFLKYSNSIQLTHTLNIHSLFIKIRRTLQWNLLKTQ